MDANNLKYIEKFHNEKLYNSYEYFGAHLTSRKGEKGVLFRVWAPNAWRVSLVGSFNYWNDESDIMRKIEGTGIWEYFFANIEEGEVYKYKIFTGNGEVKYKADPYAFYSEVRPDNSSVVVDIDKYKWQNKDWKKRRKKKSLCNKPINIYEVHAGSWRKKDNGEFLNYRELADELVPYMKIMNYNFLELMPVMEHPLDESWGYQITGYYSITSRYGKPEDLMYLVDKCHEAEIGVIFDWVPGHFCRDDHGLMNFDGWELYGGIDHPNWGTKKFDFSKREVKNFLISNALFYFEKYQIDGIRIDGVTSILQLNFGMEGSYYKNKFGGTEDLDGIEFLRELNIKVFKEYPYAIMAAEESTDWPLVTYPVDKGGLGFNYKWNMGWMNDTLDYIEQDPIYRKSHHEKITFSMHYAFSENFILPFSHDEVVHGKKSLIDKSYGSYKEKFKNLKLLALYQITHPGKKLSFMGNEIGQFVEWRFYEELEWFLLSYPLHDAHREFIKKLNAVYLKENALWYKDDTWDGYQWIDPDNRDQSIYTYIRKGKKDYIITILNFTPVAYEKFKIGVPEKGEYRIILNSDDKEYEGTGLKNKRYIKAEKVKMHGFDYSIEIKLSGLTGLLIKKKSERKRKRK
ncbi:MAG: 1,4-alpha-glucan branching protein GlgB [Eubacteriales bacterium]